MEVQKSRSVVIKKFGGYDSLLVENFELPPLEGNVEVQVEYGGLNFADLYTRQGLKLHDKKLPFILGMECTGTITAIGIKESNLKIGQRVICYDYKGGMFSSVIRINPENCYPLPEFIDDKTGAAIFVNYLTAYFCLNELGHLKENEKILMQSCGGGVGCAATQIAKTLKGVQVFGTGSKLKREEVTKNGVDVFYSNEDFVTEVGSDKFDLIIANEGGPMFEFLQSLLKPLGRIVLIGATNLIQNEHKLSMFTLLKAWWTTKYISPESLIMNNRVVAGLHLGVLLEQNRDKVNSALNYIFSLIKEQKIQPKIHSVWTMPQIVEATRLLGERKNIGKVLVCMK